MAIMESLSLAHGGGVSPILQKAMPNDLPGVIIGLGGSGFDAVCSIKKTIYESLQPDDPLAAHPGYRRIKFLTIDSDLHDFFRQPDIPYAITEREFLSIEEPQIVPALKIPWSADPEFSWLREHDICFPLAASGAGGIRQIGRFLMMRHSKEILDRLMQLFAQLQKEVLPAMGMSRIHVHLVSGLSGGTGSGIFLDICYLIRKALDLVGVKDHRIYGYFFMPDVNLTRAIDPQSRLYIQQNGYAALKELDHCMQLSYNGGGFTQQYQAGIRAEWNTAPVDFCHLIGATDASGMLYRNGYDIAMHTVSEYILQFFTQTGGLPLPALLHGIPATIAALPKCTGCYNGYLTIGYANARLPMKEIHTYFAAALFDRFSDAVDNAPGQEQLAKLANALSLEDNFLFGMLRKACGSFEPLVCDPAMPPSDLSIQYNTMFAQASRQLSAAFLAMTDMANENSYVRYLCNRLKGFAADREYGPYCIARLTDPAQEYQLFSVLQGLRLKNKERMAYETKQHTLLQQSCLEAMQAYTASNVFNRKRIRRAYEQAAWDDYQNRLSLVIGQHLEMLLDAVKHCIEEEHKRVYVPLCRVWNDLSETFAENIAILQQAPQMDTHEFPMFLWTDLRSDLDHHVAKTEAEGGFTAFVSYLLAHSEDLQTWDETYLSKRIHAFFTDSCSVYAARSMNDYLAAVYHTNHSPTIALMIYQNIMPLLRQHTKPIFGCDCALFDEKETAYFETVVVPQFEPSVVAAANQLSAAYADVVVLPVTASDRITMLHLSGGFPLYAYIGMRQLEQFYLQNTVAGRHLYEGNERDWYELPGVFPQSLITGHFPDRVIEGVQKGRVLFACAMQENLLRPIGFGSELFAVCRWNEREQQLLDEQLDKLQNVIQAASLYESMHMLQEINERLQTPQWEPSGLILRCDAVGVTDDTIKQNIRCDYFCASPAIQEHVKQQLDVLYAYRANIERLGEIVEQKKIRQDFFDALFIGIILAKERNVVCCYQDAFGQEQSIKLCTPFPPYASLSLYQAYVSYQELSVLQREEIRTACDIRKDEQIDQVRESVGCMRKQIDEAYIAKLSFTAEACGEKRDSILQFYRGLLTALSEAALYYDSF